MTPKQVALVQVSWEKVQPAAAAAADLFYDRLFHLDPLLRPLFRGERVEQGRKLTRMITFAVNGLSRLEGIAPGLQALGRRHAAYGVQDSHYETVGTALLWTLAKGLGPSFTSEVSEAWKAAYAVLSSTMREAAKEPAAGEPA